MPRTILPVANGFYMSESLPVSAQECINYYPHIPDAPALASEVLFGAPGMTQVATAGPSITSACRGAHSFEDRGYFVMGNSLIRLNVDSSVDNLGTISGSGRVSMDDNGTQLMVLVPGGSGYIHTADPDTLTTITDTDFTANGAPQHVRFIDSYFVCTTDEKKFIVSALNDGLSYNALDFGTAESSPDGVVVPIVYNNQLFIGGEHTMEAFNNIGGNDFPFQRTGLFLDEGVAAPFSVVEAQGTFMFIGAGENEGPAVWALEGNGTSKVSTKAIDSILQRLTRAELSGVFAWSYGQAGHYFTGFTLPHTTLVYDSSNGRWHERRTRLRRADETYDSITYRLAGVAAANGSIYVGDSQDGRIGLMDLDVYTEYESEIIRTFSTQPFQNNMEPFFVPMLELTVESGIGTTTASTPKTYDCLAYESQLLDLNPTGLWLLDDFAVDTNPVPPAPGIGAIDSSGTGSHLYVGAVGGVRGGNAPLLETCDGTFSYSFIPGGWLGTGIADDTVAAGKIIPSGQVVDYCFGTVLSGHGTGTMFVQRWWTTDMPGGQRYTEQSFTIRPDDTLYMEHNTSSGDTKLCDLPVSVNTIWISVSMDSEIQTFGGLWSTDVDVRIWLDGVEQTPVHIDAAADGVWTCGEPRKFTAALTNNGYDVMWYRDSKLSTQEASMLSAAFDQNQSDYVDPSPAVNAQDPQIRMQISRDGGHTYSDERARPMGKIGEYFRRCIWRRNGRSARYDVYKFTMSDPVKPVVIQLTAQIEGGESAAA